MESNKLESITSEELVQLKTTWKNVDSLKQKIAENTIMLERISNDKPKLLFEFNNAEATYLEFQKILTDKYGENVSVNMQTGIITYK